MSSSPTESITQVDNTSIKGLSTPRTNNPDIPSAGRFPKFAGESTSKTNDASESEVSVNNGKAVSVFDIALGIEQKLESLETLFNEKDKDINDRIDTILQRVSSLELKIKGK